MISALAADSLVVDGVIENPDALADPLEFMLTHHETLASLQVTWSPTWKSSTNSTKKNQEFLETAQQYAE